MRPIELKEVIKTALNKPGAASTDFDLNKDVDAPKVTLRDAAVLMPFVVLQNDVRIVLTKRSSALKHHPGQVAFPGGKRDDQDSDLIATALREAQEEIALPQGCVEVLGALPPHQTVTGFQVTPVIGWIEAPVDFQIEVGEVAEVFSVPARNLLDLAKFQVEGRIWRGQIRKYYTIPHGPYYIWGATARMLRALAEQVQK